MKIRIFESKNYKGIFINNKTIRIALDPGKEIKELDYPEFYDVKITNVCEGKCKYCFTEDTLVKTIDGNKKIRDIVNGDTVINVDLKKNKVITNEVSQLHCRDYKGELIQLEMEDGKILKMTPNHKVYTLNRGWIRADNLNENDDLYILDN
jgi:hypothetical protein